MVTVTVTLRLVVVLTAGCSGYMSPEYAMDGVFSTKSDVFSFGVLVLEIVSGKKNRGFYHNELDLNLLRYVSSSTIFIFRQSQIHDKMQGK